jgi:rhodanese-related sulfurtransferase
MFQQNSGVPEIDSDALYTMLRDGTVNLVDVREADEYARERIIGANLMPLSKFQASDLNQEKDLVITCRSGQRSAQAVMYLRQQGFNRVSNHAGGILAWKKAGYATAVDASAPMPKR